jgi:uncharacterized protein (DUF1800 family)
MSSKHAADMTEALRAQWLERYGWDMVADAPGTFIGAGADTGLARERDWRAGPAITDPVVAQVTDPDAPMPPLAVRVLARAGFGHTEADIAAFNAGGANDQARLAAWVDSQLNWAAINDSALESRLAAAGYTHLGKTLEQYWAQHVVADPEYSIRMRPFTEVQRAKFVRATFSRRQLRERMVDFWHDHFNVLGNEFSIGPVFAHYDRDVIRANALGNFRTMLEAVAKSPAMMFYLDNLSNTRGGPNENYARELLELHTFGAEHYLGFTDPFQVPPAPEDASYPSGYTDIDVYETAACFTGWTIANGHWQFPTENTGAFVYRSTWHDQGPKFVLGRLIYPERPALRDGQDVLDRLASHPKVAKFVCHKLVTRLVGELPNRALADAAAEVFRANWQAPDQIAKVVRFILLSQPFLDTWGTKTRRPFETVVAALRASGSTFSVVPDGGRSNDLMWLFGFTGNLPFNWAAPNGYPDVSRAWLGSNALAMGWRVLDWLASAQQDTTALMPILEESRSKLGTANWTARKLVEYWCGRLLGVQPPAARKNALIAFLAQNGNPETDLITDTENWVGNNLRAHRNQSRIRSMVALVMLGPDFLTR